MFACFGIKQKKLEQVILVKKIDDEYKDEDDKIEDLILALYKFIMVQN